MELQCPFERILVGGFAACSQSSRVAEGERLSVACASPVACTNCRTLVALLREHARFTLKVTNPDAALPFGKEMKVMLGGLHGLRRLLGQDIADGIESDIHRVVAVAQGRFGSLAELPFSDIVRDIAAIRPRRS